MSIAAFQEWTLNKTRWGNLTDSGTDQWTDVMKAAQLVDNNMQRKICGVFKHPCFLSPLSTWWLWEKNDHEWRVYVRLWLVPTEGGMWLTVMVGSCLQSQRSELERQLERTAQ